MKFLLLVAHESESEEEAGAYGETLGNDTLDDIEFNPPTQRTRRSKQKRNWITPRLLAALDKARVKRMRLEN